MYSQIELPQGMKSTFKRAIASLGAKHQKKNTITSLTINENWTVYLSAQTMHYYAVQTDAASTITANTACIRKAYRIDPATGNYLSERLHDEGEEEHFTFAVKRYDSSGGQADAAIEVETLQQHQFAEPLFTVGESQCPVVISIYYPGQPLTKLETAETQGTIKELTFMERIDLCYQLAKQYYSLHHHPDGAKLHIDVKGQNTIIYRQPGDTRWRARLIDFGSVKRVKDAQQPVPTTIAGMTEYAIAPEVISQAIAARSATWPRNRPSGSVSERSDVYAFSAIIMSLLGATSAYEKSHVQQKNYLEHYDIAALQRGVSQGFTSKGMFTFNEQAKLSFHFSGQVRCAYKRMPGLAPDKATVLGIPDTKPCYLAYDNHLLYLDGTTVYGYGRTLRNLDKALAGIENCACLSPDMLAQLDKLTAYPRKNTGAPLQICLQEHIKRFLDLMSHKEPNERPSSMQVYSFFKTVYAMCHLSESHCNLFDQEQTKKSPQTIERQLKLMQLQLQWIEEGLCDATTLTVMGATPEQDTHYQLAAFDLLTEQMDFQGHYDALRRYIDELKKYHASLVQYWANSDGAALPQPPLPPESLIKVKPAKASALLPDVFDGSNTAIEWGKFKLQKDYFSGSPAFFRPPTEPIAPKDSVSSLISSTSNP
jgi:hypothetical protein